MRKIICWKFKFAKEQITKALDSKKVELDFEALNKKLESEKIDVTKFNNGTWVAVQLSSSSRNYE